MSLSLLRRQAQRLRQMPTVSSSQSAVRRSLGARLPPAAALSFRRRDAVRQNCQGDYSTCDLDHGSPLSMKELGTRFVKPQMPGSVNMPEPARDNLVELFVCEESTQRSGRTLS